MGGTIGLGIGISSKSGFVPDPDCFRSGFDLFFATYEKQTSGKSFYAILTTLGSNLWKKYQADKALKVKLEEAKTIKNQDEISEDLENRPRWTPDSMKKWIEGVIMQVSLLIRRARFFCILSESSVYWESSNDQASGNLIMIHQGKITHSMVGTQISNLPVPPNGLIPNKERQRYFDVYSYQRLRILISELRRIMKTGRMVRICLRPSRTLDPDQVAGFLKWI